MKHIQDFAGHTALVTGAASGIGASCARTLAARGCSKLVLVDLDRDGLNALDLPCKMHLISGSVADPQLWSDLETDLGQLDHAVVNAGISASGLITDLEFSEWRRVLDVNLDGAFLTLATAMRAMQKAGGSIVITSSTTGIKPIAGIGPYGVSKAAIAHMARIAALEGMPQKIRVNAIAPGGVDTAIWDSSDVFRQTVAKQGRQTALKGMAETTPRGEFATADEIADTILYLLSDAAANITGHVMVSDGGFTL